MAEPIHTNLLICERILTEQDGAHSAIRIADTYNLKPSDIPPEKRPVVISVLFMAKFPPEDDAEHKIDIKLERPNGEIFDVGESDKKKLSGDDATGSPKGLNVAARFGVFPVMMGTHYVIIDLDGKRAGRAPFTLRETAPKEADPDPEPE